MKTTLTTILICLALNVRAITPFYFQGFLPSGAAQTNLCIITPWPPNQPFYIYGTNIITGLVAQTNTPSSTGFFTNMLYPGVYTVQFQNFQTVGFFVQIYDTTNQFSLGIYATNTPIVSQTYGAMFNVVTNWLGYWPATNTLSGITAAQGYQSASNTDARLTLALTNSTLFVGTNQMVVRGLTAIAPLTNSFVTNADNTVTPTVGYSVSYVPATNTPAGIIAALQYTPATNTPAGVVAALQYTPATNTPAGIAAAQQYVSATNTTAGIWAALGYVPPTNGVPILLFGTTNFITFSQTNNAPLNTNAIVWVSVQITGMTNAWKLPLMQ